MRTCQAVIAVCSLFVWPKQAESQTYRDSATVRIAENTTPAWTQATAWRIAREPFADIGGQAGDSLDELSEVRGVGRLRDGRIIVANGATRTIRVYDTRGRFLSTFGGRGNGPGEFQEIWRLIVLGDTIVALNIPGPPLMDAFYFSSRAAYLGKSAVFAQDQPAITPQFFPDGSFVGFNLDIGSRPTRAAAGTQWTDSLKFLLVRPAARRVDTLNKFPWTAKHANLAFTTGAAVTFGPRARLAAARDGFYAGFPNEYSVGFHAKTGALQRIVRRTVAPRPVPKDAAAMFRAKYDEFNVIPAVVQGSARRETEALRATYLAGLTFATVLPSFGDLIVDKSEHLWVQRFEVQHGVLACKGFSCIPTFDAPSVWDVFDPAGTWLGPVTLPARFTPLEIGTDYLAGLFRDEDDVEHVRVYAITKPARQ